ncbi:MAG: hypothetical protein OYH77_04235 [Pseudomonadota bacterium]|nr:hypothetical protein [Pseudomonadota bacterium]
MKLRFLLIIALLSACGHSEQYEVSAFKDEFYSLSLVESEAGYRFQVCSDGKCINPFYRRGGAEEAVFADIPDVSALNAQGKMKVFGRRALGSAAVVVIATLAMVVVPVAAYKALRAILTISKKGARGVDTMYDKTIKKMHAEAEMKALRDGKPVPTLAETEESLKFLQSKWAKFLAAFLAVQAVVGSVEFGVVAIKSILNFTRDEQWGETELLVARNFSFMMLASDLPVSDVKKVLNVLRKHLNLVFSDSYVVMLADS